MKQTLNELQNEIKIRNEELHVEQENTKKLLNEKVVMEQRICRLEKKKNEEVMVLILILF